MWRRHLVALLITGAAFLLLAGSVDRAAVAQDLESSSTVAQKTAGVQDVAALIKRSAVPVRLYGVEAPDTLMVGEEGRFAGSANIESASLPVRFEWEFGDGTTAEGLHAVHRYASPGVYEVRLKVSNRHGEATGVRKVVVLSRETEAAAE